MAGGFVSQTPGVRNYNYKLTPKVFVTCFIGAFGGLIFGYDLGISGLLFFQIQLLLLESDFGKLPVSNLGLCFVACRRSNLDGAILGRVLPLRVQEDEERT